MRLRWLVIPIGIGAVLAWRNEETRRRLTSLCASLGLPVDSEPDARTDGGFPVVPVRTTSSGDVETEDRAGTWADDGGSGVGGGQQPTSLVSDPLRP
jgi:hypothetical protein